MIDEKRTYAAGDRFKFGTCALCPIYILVISGKHDAMLIRADRDSGTKWIIRGLSDIDAITYDELRAVIGKFFERMDNYDN